VDEAPSEQGLITLMTGREIARSAAAHAGGAGPQDPQGKPTLEVEDVRGGPLRGVSLSVRPGEIVGLTGLVGSGRTSLLKTVFGVHRPSAGAIRIHGRDQSGREDVKKRMRQGVAYVSEDRVGESSFAELNVRENLSASVLRTFWRLRGMSASAERRTARDLVATHSVKTQSVDSGFSTLSGGNQQKAVLARWLRRSPSLLLLDEPTQGVDIMSRTDIYDTIRATAAEGCAVVVASSDFIELCALCDRVVVLRDGVVGDELRGDELTPDHLTAVTQSSVLTSGDAR
jgi:ribose transport system ATP-binding protein